ncbi:hypothetical protein MRB53_009918 [Persea americana]|uniref:Uncharacterized protein n=1 Tax=Persea americana TaxID=3435 RepID=A0ACC2LQA6_PERAE|nr:hypothetical protein MRB53_009918 [Persea americana]
MGSTSLQAHNQWKILEEGLNSNIAARLNQIFSNIRKTGKGLNIAPGFRIQNLQSSSENPYSNIAESSKSQDLRKDFQLAAPVAARIQEKEKKELDWGKEDERSGRLKRMAVAADREMAAMADGKREAVAAVSRRTGQKQGEEKGGC